MRPATALGMALAIVLPALAAAAPPAGLAAPQAGELYYYEGTRRDAEGEAPWAVAVLVGAPQAVGDRAGLWRQAYPVLHVSPAPGRAPAGLGALLADPDARRDTWWYDAATHEAVAYDLVLRLPADGSTPLEGTPLAERFEARGWTGVRRSYFDPGLPHPLARLWGQPLPEGPLDLDVVVGAQWGWQHRTGSLGRELLGVGPGLVQAPAGAGDAHRIAARFEPVAGDGPRWYEGSYGAAWAGAPVRVRQAFALAPGLAFPVAERSDDGATALDIALVAHARGAPLLELTGPGPAPAGAVAALGPAGPADGGARLAYPLAEAVRAVRADPSLGDLQAMLRRGEPVLVKAFYELRREPDKDTPLPEARWVLVFHDAAGASAAVESKRPLGAPLAVNRPQDRADGAPHIGGVAAHELPANAPTLGAALAAWQRWEHGGRDANVLYYALRRTPAGEVQPLVWAGRSLDAFGAWPDGTVGDRQEQALLALDADGRARFTMERETTSAVRVAPAWQAGAAPGAPPLAAPGEGAWTAAGAGVGGAVALGLALWLLAPFYSRLGPARVLGHPVRRALLDLVRGEPGVHLGEAQQRLGLGRGAAAYHVHVLAQRGYLRVHASGRYRRLFPAGTDPAAMARAAALRQPRTRALHELVRAHPGVGLREAARRLGVPASSLQWHATRLADAGLLDRRRDGLYPAGPSSAASAGHDAS